MTTLGHESRIAAARPLIRPLAPAPSGHGAASEIWGQFGKNVVVSAGLSLGLYAVIHLVTRVSWLRALPDVWAYDPGSIALSIAAVAVTLFVATSLSDAWHATAATEHRTFTKRVVTSNLTRLVYVAGAGIAWFAVLDAFTSPHHPLGLLVSVLVALLCCLLHVAQEDPHDLRTWRADHLGDEVRRLRLVVDGYRDALSRTGAAARRVWWGGLAGVVAAVLVLAGALVDALRGAGTMAGAGTSGTVGATMAAGLVVLAAGVAALAQMSISTHDMVRARLEHLLHGRHHVVDVVLTNAAGSVMFIAFAVTAWTSEFRGMAGGLLLAALVAPVLTMFVLRASAGFNHKVLALAEQRLARSELKLVHVADDDGDEVGKDGAMSSAGELAQAVGLNPAVGSTRAVGLIRAPQLSDVAEYAYAATVAKDARLVFLAGSCPLDAEGNTVGVDDYAVQASACIDNMHVALAAAGASMTDVISTRVLVASTSQADLVTAWRVVRAAFGDHDVPSTLMGVTVLGYDHQLVEIEAVAALID